MYPSADQTNRMSGVESCGSICIVSQTKQQQYKYMETRQFQKIWLNCVNPHPYNYLHLPIWSIVFFLEQFEVFAGTKDCLPMKIFTCTSVPHISGDLSLHPSVPHSTSGPRSFRSGDGVPQVPEEGRQREDGGRHARDRAAEGAARPESS